MLAPCDSENTNNNLGSIPAILGSHMLFPHTLLLSATSNHPLLYVR